MHRDHLSTSDAVDWPGVILRECLSLSVCVVCRSLPLSQPLSCACMCTFMWSLCVCLCVYICVCVHVAEYFCMQTDQRRSVTFLSLPAVSVPHGPGLTDAPAFLHECWGFELWSSCLLSKCQSLTELLLLSLKFFGEGHDTGSWIFQASCVPQSYILSPGTFLCFNTESQAVHISCCQP